MTFEQGERGAGVTPLGGGALREGGGDHVLADVRMRGVVDQLDLRGSGTEDGDGLLAVAGPDRFRQRRDRAGEPVRVVEDDDRQPGRRFAAWRAVPALSAGEADPAEPADNPPTMSASTAPASTGVSWSGSPTRISRASGRTAASSRPINVSDTIEVSSTTITSYGSRLSRWKPQPRRSRPCPEQSVQGRRGQLAEPGPVLRTEGCRGGLNGLLQPGRGLSGRRRQRDPQRAPRLVGEQREDPRDRGGLAGAGAAADHHRPGPDALQSCRSLLGGLGKQPVQRSVQPGLVDHRRGGGRPVEQVGTDLDLFPPVPIEVEQPEVEAQRMRLRAQRARPDLVHPAGRIRPRQVWRQRGQRVADRRRPNRAGPPGRRPPPPAAPARRLHRPAARGWSRPGCRGTRARRAR